MAVNNNFYSTINNLVQQSTGQANMTVVDYASFIDAGKKITELTNTEWQNNFLGNLMNRIGLYLNTYRSYNGKYKDISMGNIPNGGNIEIITNLFYDTQAASFVNLPEDGQPAPDQWEIHKPKVLANFYTEDNTYTIPVTIQKTRLRKAWDSPADMDAFINGVMGMIVNSNESAKERARIGLVAGAIAHSYNAGKVIKLVDEYNRVSAESVTPDNALINPKFVRFATEYILRISRRIESRSSLYNPAGIDTFTPADSKHLFLSNTFSSAMRTWIYTIDGVAPVSAPSLTDYIDVDYWQGSKFESSIAGTVKQPEMRVQATEIKNGTGAMSDISAPVVGVLCDKFSVMEFLDQESLDATPYNARTQTWNYWYNVSEKLIRNDNANFVVFTLE